MSEQAPPPPPDVVHPRRTLARLALSAAAAELADRAAALVPILYDPWGRPGEHIEAAAGLVDQARELLNRAVVAERENHASWSTVGDALAVTRQTAHERFEPVCSEWEAALDEPYNDHGPIRTDHLPEGAADPDRSAARLDAWCTQHAPASTRALAADAGLTDRMVSAGLPAHTSASETASLLRQARHITTHGATAEQREQFDARKHAILCAHTDDGEPAHWLAPGQRCDRRGDDN